MRRILLIILSIIACETIFAARTVDNEDKELSLLVDVVKMLRSALESDYAKASQILSSDARWTPMNETGAVRPQECKPADKVVGFKLNRILSKLDRERKYVSTHGDMINGEDERYDYSLYERALKAESSAEYELRGRKGRQTIVVIPFHIAVVQQIMVNVIGQNVQTNYDEKQGTITVTFDATEEILKLVVENRTSQPQSFVILNHNSRK